jgi:4-alpha-glucanotransferase
MNKKICISLGLESATADTALPSSLEKDYQDVYKPAATFLYSHPECLFCFSFTGIQLSYYRKKHPEFLEILSQLTNRKQVEILGGGYYNPVFPLLFPMDRNGQIEMLSSEIRCTVGKRPRGMTLCASSWDSSLVTNLQTCGMEYVLLDSSLIPPSKQCFLPLIMSDRGKSIDILPVYRNLKPDNKMSAEIYFAELRKKITQEAVEKKSDSEWHTATIMFTHDELKVLIESNWLASLYRTAVDQTDCSIRLTIPSLSRKTAVRIPAFITAGMSEDIAQWAKNPYTAVPKKECYPITIYDFLQTYPQSRALYDRMLYVSMLVNQCHGDKMRKKAAREKLWESQSGEGFVCTSSGAFVNSAYRQHAYRSLIEAEKLIRECSDFEESITNFDYNGDGLNEYIFRMQNYTACVHLIGGTIRELDIMHSAGNYADNLSRVKEFDNCSDNYWRGMFVDHIFNDQDFLRYLNNEPAGDGVFSRIRYDEQHFVPVHNEIQLSAVSFFSEKKQQISLRKKYISNSNGCTVQYILKNESNTKLSAKFIVESNFAQTNFTNSDFNAYKVEIVSAGNRQEINTKKSARELNSTGLLKDVSAVQITDSDNDISFVFEPNENSGFTFVPITFMRPSYRTAEIVPAGMTFSTAMFWDVCLESEMEMEKTINLSILNLQRVTTKNCRKK